MILRDYANLEYGGRIQQTHYRSAGSGTPLILLHPSPLSSAFMVPFLELFADLARVYAPDTPGYGHSDPLPEPPDDISAYADWLRNFMLSLDIESAGIYGTATGAQIAICFGRAYPEMTDFLVLDNAGHFTDEDRAWIMPGYFPDVTPRPDGSHLQTIWNMAANLYQYFPWFDQREESRVPYPRQPGEMVDSIHTTTLAYLAAGADYKRGYNAAFNYEKAQNMQALIPPTRVIRWPGSYVRNYVDRLDAFDWPDHIRMVYCEASIESRYAVLKQTVRELMGR